MEIEVLRIGHRVVRDDRATTHVALVSRAFGADRIFMTEVGPEIRDTIGKINRTWGGEFRVEVVDSWRRVLRQKKISTKIVHLTMYGEEINRVSERIGREEGILVVVGSQKVPREVYDVADYNVSVGSQPHSEISALAVLLDRIQAGRQFSRAYPDAERRIIPDGRGKRVAGCGRGGPM